MRSYYISKDPKSTMPGVLIRGDTDMKTHRGTQVGYHVKTEADTQVTCLQTKEWQGMLETTRKE